MTDWPTTPEAQLATVQAVLQAIENAGKSVYYVAKLMRRHQTQIKRMRETGRCQPYELVMLREILADVSRETPSASSQFVTMKSSEEVAAGA